MSIRFLHARAAAPDPAPSLLSRVVTALQGVRNDFSAMSEHQLRDIGLHKDVRGRVGVCCRFLD